MLKKINRESDLKKDFDIILSVDEKNKKLHKYIRERRILWKNGITRLTMRWKMILAVIQLSKKRKRKEVR